MSEEDRIQFQFWIPDHFSALAAGLSTLLENVFRGDLSFIPSVFVPSLPHA